MATDSTTIHSYNQYAQEWAKRIRDKENIAHEFLEKPAMYSLLPDISNAAALCLGCGTGEECDVLSKKDVKNVIGIDISEGMIDVAQKQYPTLTFQVCDMEKLPFTNESFDFVYSSLTLHYVKDWKLVLQEVRRVLKPHGKFLFSTQHPVTHNASILREGDETKYLLGFQKNKKDRSISIFGDYFSNEKEEKVWQGNYKIAFYNRSLSHMVREILDNHFTICALDEPTPLESVKQKDPSFWKIYSKIPLFVIFLLEKKKIEV